MAPPKRRPQTQITGASPGHANDNGGAREDAKAGEETANAAKRGGGDRDEGGEQRGASGSEVLRSSEIWAGIVQKDAAQPADERSGEDKPSSSSSSSSPSVSSVSTKPAVGGVAARLAMFEAKIFLQ